MIPDEKLKALKECVAGAKDDILTFFREIVAIPSTDSDIEAVGARVGEELRKLGFDEVFTDKYGSIVGRIGDGPTKILFDSHLDTVGIGDPEQWEWDPFQGKVENGMLYARGALDEKGSTPGMIYGLKFAHELGLLEGYTAYYFGNIEEICDGVACQALEQWQGITPDFVVVGEPTGMTVCRGQKGRVDLQIVATGKSSHAASNYMGDNAVYKMTPIIDGIRDMDATLPTHEFLGQGRITVTRISCLSPSDNAVPDECTIQVDRRITFGESKESILAELNALIPDEEKENIQVRELIYDVPSHTGAVMEYERFFPAYAVDEDHALIQSGKELVKKLWQRDEPATKWDFSTNGNYWCGRKGIPAIGFGPGDERYAHTVDEHVPLADVLDATHFYALLPASLKPKL